jgi:hypothetical protein
VSLILQNEGGRSFPIFKELFDAYQSDNKFTRLLGSVKKVNDGTLKLTDSDLVSLEDEVMQLLFVLNTYRSFHKQDTQEWLTGDIEILRKFIKR